MALALSTSRSATPGEGIKEAIEIATQEARDPGGTLSALSNEMVGLYKEQFGRGPTKVRSDWAGPDALLVTLEDTMTPAERRLVKMGEHARLRDGRTFFQYATAEEFVGIAERVTNREVRAFVSGIDTKADVCTELFYFVPLAGGNGTNSP